LVTEDFPIRLGTLDDVETVVAHRRAMFREMGYRDDRALDTMCEAFRPWLERKMQTGEYLAWFAVDAGGSVAAGVGLWRPARKHRRMGLARKLMDVALAWCLLSGIRARLYESLGFELTNEMRISLNLN
jgi:GNAT superfamily N-acetyltransferase